MKNKENQVQSTEKRRKTFTQDEVNAIIGKRLSEQKNAADKDLLAKEEELNRREMELKARELLSERGLPRELASVLRYDDDESLNSAVEKLEEIKEEQGKTTIEGLKPLDNNGLPYGEGVEEPHNSIRDIFLE